MTVSNTTSRNQYTATSGQTVFPYTFEVFDKDDLVVLKNGTTLSEGTDYTVSGVGVDSGGNVTLVVGATAGDIITIYRDMALQRLTDYQTSGDFLAQEVNDDFDRIWLALQQGAQDSDRAIVKPITDAASIDMTLPSAADRANSYLTFDATGAPSVVAAGDPSAPDAITRQDFTGDGSTLVYTLASAPGAAGAGVMIFIDGIQQDKDSYTITGTTLTFSEAPPLNSNINLVQLKATDIGEADSASVTYIPAGTGAVETSVQSKLRETVSVKDFGAVGDGVTDDTAAIQAAVTYACSTGECLEINGNNSYVITNTISATSGKLNLLINGSILFTAGADNVDLFSLSDLDSINIAGTSTCLLSQTDGGTYSGCAAIRIINNGTADLFDITVNGVAFDGFSSHCVGIRGAKLVPIADYPILSKEDLDSRAGFKRISVINNRFNNSESGVQVYGNSEGVILNNNQGANIASTICYVDIYCRDVVITNNISDGFIVAEGGSENSIIANNIVSKIRCTFGTITTTAGENGEPHIGIKRFILNQNILQNSDGYGIQVAGTDGSAALTNPPDNYDAAATGLDYSRHISISNNIIYQSADSAIRLALVRAAVCNENIIVSCGDGTGNSRGIDITKCDRIGVRANHISDCQNGGSIVIDGTSGFESTSIDVEDNTIYLRDDGTNKTEADIYFTQYSQNCFLGSNSVDTDAAKAIQLGATVNIEVHPQRWISEPGQYFAVAGLATFCRVSKLFSDAVAVSANEDKLIGYFEQDATDPQAHQPILVVGGRFITETPHTTGTASGLHIGTSNSPTRMAVDGSNIYDISGGAVFGHVQEMVIATRSVDGNYPLIVGSNGAGTSDAVGKFQIDVVRF